GTRDLLRPGGRPRPCPGHPCGRTPRRRPRREAAQASLAADELRRRREGKAPLRLGAGRLGPDRDLAADPQERLAAVRAGLLPLPHTGPGPAKPPGDGRGRQVGGRGRGPAPRPAAEECFQAATNEAGMDHYQVRRYESWYRYVTLAMLALAFLTVTRAALADGDAGLASSANEIRRMVAALCAPL